MKSPCYDVALFDADDTLFDFGKAAKQALQRSMQAHAMPFDKEIYQTYMRINQGVWDRLERGEITRDELALERFRLFFAEIGVFFDLAEFNDCYLTELGNGWFLLPGAKALCEEAAQYCRLAIVTNGFYRVQTSRMAQSGLDAYFEKVYVSEKVGYQKPRREFFDAVLDDIHATDRSRVILLGDSLTSDMAGGIGVGIATCWYNPAGKDRKGVPVDYEIHTLSEFIPLLRGQASVS